MGEESASRLELAVQRKEQNRRRHGGNAFNLLSAVFSRAMRAEGSSRSCREPAAHRLERATSTASSLGPRPTIPSSPRWRPPQHKEDAPCPQHSAPQPSRNLTFPRFPALCIL